MPKISQKLSTVRIQVGKNIGAGLPGFHQPGLGMMGPQMDGSLGMMGTLPGNMPGGLGMPGPSFQVKKKKKEVRVSKIGKICKILQIFSGLVLGCIKTKFCKKICV